MVINIIIFNKKSINKFLTHHPSPTPLIPTPPRNNNMDVNEWELKHLRD